MDPAPSRVQLISLGLLVELYHSCQGGTAKECATANLALLAFFFLLCQGEYCESGTDTLFAPFQLRDLTFFCGDQRYPATSSTAAQRGAANFASLCFTNQKNCVKGKLMGHS